MPRYIDADALKDVIQQHDYPLSDKLNSIGNGMFTLGIFQAIDQMSTISPDEVRGVGEITGDDACPSCGCWIPTDDAHDAIFKNEVKFCYYCGMRLRMKGAEDGTTDNA